MDPERVAGAGAAHSAGDGFAMSLDVVAAAECRGGADGRFTLG